MRNHVLRKFIQAGTAVSALVVGMHSPVAAADDLEEAVGANEIERGAWKSLVVRSIVATGLNDSVGRPPFNLGSPFGSFSFAMMGAYKPGASEPLPITPNTPDSALLATIAHPNFLLIAGKTAADIPPGSQNIPFRDVPVNVDFASIATVGPGMHIPLKGVMSAGPQDVAQAEPADPITLGQWKKGRGILKIVCQSTKQATLKMAVRNLLPHRMYGIGATMGGVHGLPEDQKRLAPFTIGGVPHVFITDEHGNGEIERLINFCPLDPPSMERPLLVMNLLFYSRHQNYGAVPEPVFVNGLWLGMVTHNHLQFPVNVQLNPGFEVEAIRRD
jgi:hypothetical protein